MDEKIVKDCISRQAAIDALGEDALWDSDDEYETGMHTQWSMDVDAIKALPSVQPDYKDGWIYTGKKAWEFEPCEDTISRQAAIDAVSDCGICIQRIVELPSAQPEIIHCRDCKHYYFADNRIPQEQRYVCDIGDEEIWQPDDYCSYAERREVEP